MKALVIEQIHRGSSDTFYSILIPDQNITIIINGVNDGRHFDVYRESIDIQKEGNLINNQKLWDSLRQHPELTSQTDLYRIIKTIEISPEELAVILKYFDVHKEFYDLMHEIEKRFK